MSRYRAFLRRHLPVMASRTVGPVSIVFTRRGVVGHDWIGFKILGGGWATMPMYGVRVATIIGDVHIEWSEPCG